MTDAELAAYVQQQEYGGGAHPGDHDAELARELQSEWAVTDATAAAASDEVLARQLHEAELAKRGGVSGGVGGGGIFGGNEGYQEAMAVAVGGGRQKRYWTGAIVINRLT